MMVVVMMVVMVVRCGDYGYDDDRESKPSGLEICEYSPFCVCQFVGTGFVNFCNCLLRLLLECHQATEKLYEASYQYEQYIACPTQAALFALEQPLTALTELMAYPPPGLDVAAQSLPPSLALCLIQSVGSKLVAANNIKDAVDKYNYEHVESLLRMQSGIQSDGDKVLSPLVLAKTSMGHVHGEINSANDPNSLAVEAKKLDLLSRAN